MGRQQALLCVYGMTLGIETSPIIFSGPNSEMRNTALVAGGLSLLLVPVFAWWFAPSWPWLTGYFVLAFLAALSVPVLYRLGGFTRADELEWLEQREEQEHFEMQAELVRARSQLDKLAVPEGVRQVDVLRQLLDDYHAVVETRFRGKAKSPLAYLSAARRVQQQVIHNLNDVIATKHSLSSISRHDNTQAQFEESGRQHDKSRRDELSAHDRFSASRIDDNTRASSLDDTDHDDTDHDDTDLDDTDHDDTDHDDTRDNWLFGSRIGSQIGSRFGLGRDRKRRDNRRESPKRRAIDPSPPAPIPVTSPAPPPEVPIAAVSAIQIPDERKAKLVSLEADQQQRMTTLLDDNQQLLDALTDTAVEVANIRTVSDYDRLDTLARLVSLAEIASNTGK